MNFPPGFTSDLELEWLMQQASKHRAIVEIGCWVGRSTTALAYTDGFVLCIDDWSGDAGRGFLPTDMSDEAMTNFPGGGLADFCKNMWNHMGKVIPMKIRSQNAACLFPAPCFDMVFIDGDHKYESVHTDIVWWVGKIKEGGLLCGHNYEDCWKDDVVKAVDELVPDRKLVPGTSIWYKEML